MAFSHLEYLEKGKVDFVFSLTSYDEENIIQLVRKSERKNQIIKGFLGALKDTCPRFCLNIIYDNDSFKEEVWYLAHKYYNNNLINYFQEEELASILHKTSWGRSYIFNHLDDLLDKNNKIPEFLLQYIYLYIEECEDFFKKLALHKNLHIRGQFMIDLVENHYEKISFVYEDILKYLTGYTYQENEQMTLFPSYMPFDLVSKLAVLFLKNKDKVMFSRFNYF